jgi:Domain of unknown function (DUF4258)
MPASETLEKVKALAKAGEILVSDHGYEELAADDIFSPDVLDGLADATVIEDYPQAAKGPSVLVLQRDGDDRPIHVVWGIAKATDRPAVLVTAYRPDPRKWSGDFMKRRKQ